MSIAQVYAMFERLKKSWYIVQQCFVVLRQDRSLLLFPLFSVIGILLIMASFAAPLLPLIRTPAPGSAHPSDHVMQFLLLFLFYIFQFSVMNFFNTALVEVALRRFDGQAATTGDGLRRAWERLPVILSYSVVAATVGVLLRTGAERVGFVGRVALGLLGFVWTVATALVVPVLAAEDVGPVEAVFRSADLIRETWGEQLAGNVGINLVFSVFTGLTILIGGFAAAAACRAGGALAIAVTVVVAACISIMVLTQMTLHGIYAAALYRYADNDAATGGIGKDLLKQAFRSRA